MKKLNSASEAERIDMETKCVEATKELHALQASFMVASKRLETVQEELDDRNRRLSDLSLTNEELVKAIGTEKLKNEVNTCMLVMVFIYARLITIGKYQKDPNLCREVDRRQGYERNFVE